MKGLIVHGIHTPNFVENNCMNEQGIRWNQNIKFLRYANSDPGESGSKSPFISRGIFVKFTFNLGRSLLLVGLACLFGIRLPHVIQSIPASC